MKRYAALIGLLIAFVLPMGAAARETAWVPGTSVLVTEQNAAQNLEIKMDWAYCMGIRRFGHSGSFPYEKFRVFDCDMKLNGVYYSDWRYRAVKAQRYGYFKLVLVKRGRSW